MPVKTTNIADITIGLLYEPAVIDTISLLGYAITRQWYSPVKGQPDTKIFHFTTSFPFCTSILVVFGR